MNSERPLTSLSSPASLHVSLSSSTRPSIFASIPPERIGLNGEYDHNGLAKRVLLAFQQEFAADTLTDIRVKQRGRVVILMGKVCSNRLLARMIQVALKVHGAADVESYGVAVETSSRSNELCRLGIAATN